MHVKSRCPDGEQLRDLLANTLPATDQAELVSHLDSCTSCQHALENAATGDWAWQQSAQLPQATPPETSAFWPALQNVESIVKLTPPESEPSVERERFEFDDISLDFLAPAEIAGHLGRLGHFEIVEVVGRGGMGVVLKALDSCLERVVAIKVLDPRYAKDELSRKRFCREARAAAAVTHEHVVAIHQVERDEGQDLPFLVMQYVPGMSLQDLLDKHSAMELPEILRIGRQIAAGLAAAHAQGLIHRDIKPANILLQDHQATDEAGSPSLSRTLAATATVKITDFGLARAAEDVKLTQTGFVAGTPLYMAPEQARGETLDYRADLFSLGSVLYAMCTGKPPFGGSTPYLVLKSLTEDLPPPIQEINPKIPDWLVSIIDHLHAKNPADRIQSASEVALILERHLAEVQVATPAKSPGFRSSRSLPRTKATHWSRAWTLAGVAVWGLLAALVLGELAGLTHFRSPAGPTSRLEVEEPSPALRSTLNANTGPIWSVAFSPDGTMLAMALDDGTVKLWDPHSGKVLNTLEAHDGPVWSVAFSRDGSRLATASDDGTVKLWDSETKKQAKVLKHETAVRPVAFSPTQELLATGGRNGRLIQWNLATASEITAVKGHKGVIMSIAFSPDGKTLASAGSDKTVRLWDVATGQEQLKLHGHAGGVYAVTFAADGKRLASGSWDRTVRIWDAAAGNPLATLRGHSQDVWSVAFSPDGKTLASGSEDRTVKLWDADSGSELTTLHGHTGTVYSVAFARDGRTIASGGRDGTVKLWDTPSR